MGEPPRGARWWPDRDAEPSFIEAPAVVRYGDRPEECRLIRYGDGTGWTKRGARVGMSTQDLPPLSWDVIGACSAGEHHPVVALGL